MFALLKKGLSVGIKSLAVPLRLGQTGPHHAEREGSERKRRIRERERKAWREKDEGKQTEQRNMAPKRKRVQVKEVVGGLPCQRERRSRQTLKLPPPSEAVNHSLLRWRFQP